MPITTSQLVRLRTLASGTANCSETPPDFRAKSESLRSQLPALDGKIEEFRHRLTERFAKKTITVSVAGKARQGKSTNLKAISGLTVREIPAHSGLPRTGAKSRILHRDGDPHAEIEFHTAAEFLRDIVHAYFAELKLSPLPATIEEFGRPLPALRPGALPEETAIYGKLKEVYDGLGEYRVSVPAAEARLPR